MTLLPEHIALLTTNAQAMPVCFHSAVLFRWQDTPMVVHNTMSGIEILPLSDFAKQRKIYRIRQFPLKRTFDIYEIADNGARIPFSWTDNNCEDFTSRIINRYTYRHCCVSSPQRLAIILAATAVLILALILLHKR